MPLLTTHLSMNEVQRDMKGTIIPVFQSSMKDRKVEAREIEARYTGPSDKEWVRTRWIWGKCESMNLGFLFSSHHGHPLAHYGWSLLVTFLSSL